MICDRDKKEVNGIDWLISKYALPISAVLKADKLSDTLHILENELPDILFIELDMVPEEKWEIFRSYLDRYSKHVVALTAETTFERAMQAMSIGTIDLLIKPLSPNLVTRSLQQVVRNIKPHIQTEKEWDTGYSPNYESLFIEDNVPFEFPVYLIETELIEVLHDLREFIGGFNFYYKPTVLSTSDRIVLVFNQHIPDCVNQAKRLLREWELQSNSPLAIAVHKIRSGASLHSIYMDLQKAINITFYTGYRQVILSDDFQDWKTTDPFLTMKEQRKWIYMLDAGETDKIKAWMYDEFFNIESPYPEPGIVRTQLTSILAQIRRYMIRCGIEDESSEAYYNEVFGNILHHRILYRVVQDVILFVSYLFELVKKQSQEPKINVVEEAISYMEVHYVKADLSLLDVATHVERSGSYFSYLLSSQYGQSFRELLNYIRIQKAKELLSSSTMPIQNIAIQVGFKNPNYFSRVFKKHTDKSPRDFQKTHSK